MLHKQCRQFDKVNSCRVTVFPSDRTLFTAREQVWFNGGFHEQLVLFELCKYQPSSACPYYTGWRQKLDAHLAEQT